MTDWKLWENPSVADDLKFSILIDIRLDEEERDPRGYAHLYEVYEDGETIVTNSEVVEFNFTNETARIRPAGDYEYVRRLSNIVRYGSKELPLVDPATLGVFVESLKVLDQPTIRYRFYTDGRRAAIVKEEIEEPETKPEEKRPAYQCCTLSPTGYHQSDGRESLLSCGGKRPRKVGCCKHCMHLLDISAFPEENLSQARPETSGRAIIF